MSPYTVVYALTRDLGPHECYHHVAQVTAAHDLDAITRCQQDALPGFEFHMIAVFDGHLAAVAMGKATLGHSFAEKDHDAS